jgi:pimeloyl-ACP methyl ester carboxylesterase
MINDPTTLETRVAHHTASVNGVRLHYVIGGKGDPVVLLHGWPQTWYGWRRIIPALTEQYTVIAPDLRGLGDSSKPTTGYDKRTLGEDIYQLVHQLGFERVFLVGHDFGAGVAYAYAAAHPQDVRRLAILEFILAGFGLEQTMNISPEEGLWHMAFHYAAEPDLPEALLSGKERVYLSWFYRYYAYNPAAITPTDIDEYVRCYSAPGGLRAGFEYYRTIFDDAAHNKESAKTKLTMPVLALGGDSCLQTLPLNSMQGVAEDVHGGVVEHCGHWMAEERPDSITQQLLGFFK